MILLFPNRDTLLLAITSATVPEAILRASASMKITADQEYSVQFDEKLSRDAAANLKKLGVKVTRKSPKGTATNVTCWHQLVPPQQDNDATTMSTKTPVLFSIPSYHQMAEMVTEMLRLGNDRQSYRYLTGKKQQERSLLRVVAPPYYSLLGAIDSPIIHSENGSTGKPNQTKQANGVSPSGTASAFVERTARVWVQFGYRHPLISQIQAPVGQHVLIDAMGSWEFIDEAPFQDIYQALETHLPSKPSELSSQSLPNPIQVPLRLTRVASNDAAEMWVIKKDALKQVESLVATGDNRLISRLSFAVSESEGSVTVVIRVRPSKLSPPCLVLDAVPFRSYLKLPNLFLPVGQRLHPPLRRDAVSQLLASETDLITWLYPDADGGAFQTQQIADSAFQPLNHWVDYILDRESESLNAWANSFQFEFESYTTDEFTQSKKPTRRRPTREEAVKVEEPAIDDSTLPEPPQKEPKEIATDLAEKPDKKSRSDSSTPTQAQLKKLETTFLELDEPVDGPRRAELWKEMGPLNTKLKRRHDATVCWSNACWQSNENDWIAAWLKSEIQCSTMKSTKPSELKKLLDQSEQIGEGTVLAAYLTWAANQPTPPEFAKENLIGLTQALQLQENQIPVRTAWLAWHSVYQLSDGDVLALARARDRILERLFQTGLTPEFDMPSFLRAQGMGSNERYRTVQDQLRELAEPVESWVEDASMYPLASTREYTQIYFAYAWAQMGESRRCNELLESATTSLREKKDPVHGWLSLAFQDRIRRALNNESQQAPFSESLLESLEAMDRMDRYKINQLRQKSRLLEPTQSVDPFTRFHQRYANEFSKQLHELTQLTDRNELQERIESLLNENGPRTKSHRELLATALQLAPRTGEQFAYQLIDLVFASLKKSKEAFERAMLLQKATFVAAHFGRVDAVQKLVAEFEQSLPDIVDCYLKLTLQDKEKIDTLESLFTESFQGLRQLGMRDEIGNIYGKIAELLNGRIPKKTKRRSPKKPDMDATRPLRLLLCVAGGWHYFGQYSEATDIVNSIREHLFDDKMTPIEQKNLTCAYAQAVAMAPPQQAKRDIAELFEMNEKGQKRLANIHDKMQTQTHFSISQLSVVESVILALVNDEYSLNSESRRWLDEDEFLVRSRIHRDVQQVAN